MTGISEPAFEKLIKLMMLTTSQHDGEALNALRIANTILAAGNYNWSDFLRGKIVTFPDIPDLKPARTPKYSDHDEIDGYFDILLNRHISPSFKTFVDSVHEWWTEKGFLTEAQYRAIKNAAGARQHV